MSKDFRICDLNKLNQNDFIYIDPPYLIANADYNAGRTAKLSWGAQDETALYQYLDEANKKQIKWAVSNFLKYKDKVNTIVEDWAREHGYNIYDINCDYSNLTTKADRIPNSTVEVLITNYNQ